MQKKTKLLLRYHGTYKIMLIRNEINIKYKTYVNPKFWAVFRIGYSERSTAVVPNRRSADPRGPQIDVGGLRVNFFHLLQYHKVTII